MAETVLVTGGTGYVAGWCIVDLLKRGYTVRATVRDLKREGAVRAVVTAGGATADDQLTFVAAELTADKGWNDAVSGCTYVLHVASPLGLESSRDPNALIVPARDGALRVLRAAARAGVKRVVMTSSCAAANPSIAGNSLTDETVWTDPTKGNIDAYRLSKTYSERAAWDFMANEGGAMQLTTILPSAVFGPVLTAENLGSVRVILRLLQGGVGRIPRLGMCIVDVRDVADAHVRAMTAVDAGGDRLIASGPFMWMEEIAQTLRHALGERAKRVPTGTVPDFMVRIAALFNPELRQLLPLLGRKNQYSWDKATQLIGYSPRPAAETVIACAESLYATGALKR